MSRTTCEQKGSTSSLAHTPGGRATGTSRLNLLTHGATTDPQGAPPWLFTPPPPGHLALPHLLLTVCCCTSHPAVLPHTCARRQTLGQRHHRDPTAAESLPGPHGLPNARPSLGEACLPLPPTSCPEAVQLFPADTPRGTGLPDEWEAHQWAGSPLTDFAALSLSHNEHLGHLGCVCRESVLGGGEKKMEEESQNNPETNIKGLSFKIGEK